MDEVITAEEFRAAYNTLYGHDIPYAKIKKELGLTGRVTKQFKMQSSDLRTLARKLRHRKLKQPQAGSSSSGGAHRTRARKSQARAPKDFNILPGDYKILNEVQEWVDSCNDVLPENFKPSKVKESSRDGMIAYEIPGYGWVDVPAVDFAKMKNGTKPWKRIEPSKEEVRRQAKKLEKLSFQAKECRVCNKEIKEGTGPEYALMYHLLSGRFVLPYIDHELKDRQTEARFRRNHLICSILENEIAKILVVEDAELEGVLDLVISRTLEQAQQKQPDLTEDDVEEKLDDVLAYIEEA